MKEGEITISDFKKISLLISKLEKIFLVPLILGLIYSLIQVVGLIVTSSYNLTFYVTLIFLIIFALLSIHSFKKKGIKNTFSDLQNMYFYIVESKNKNLNDMRDQLKKEYEKQIEEVQDQKEEYYIKSKLFGIKNFIDKYSFYFNEDEIITYFQKNPQKDLDFEEIFNYYNEINGIPKLIFNLLFMEFFSKPNQAIWNEIKKNRDFVKQIIDILLKAEKLTLKYKKVPIDVLCNILLNQTTFSIKLFNQNIIYLSKFTKEINLFFAFLKEEKIDYQEYKLWEEILELNDIFINNSNMALSFWNAFMHCIKLEDEMEYKEEIKRIIVFFYMFKMKSEDMEDFIIEMSKSENNCKILYYISRNKGDESLGPFILENWGKLGKFIHSSTENVFFSIFYEQMKKGRFSLDNNKLFKLYVDDGVFDLSYLNQLFFNPLIPIDFEYAINYYFKLNTSITTLLRNLKIEAKQKLFLLTFTSGKGTGGIAKAINDLSDKDNFPGIASNYGLLQYSDSARIGISKKGAISLEQLRKEMLSDLKKTIPNMDVAKKLLDNFKSFLKKCYVPIEILNPKSREKFESEFNDFVGLKIDKSQIIEQFIKYNKILENHSRYDKIEKDFKLYWPNLINQIKNYPPDYQILLHELENDPKKIEVFGNYQKIDPFIKIKELYAYRTTDKESLLISAEFQDEYSKRISIEEINQKLIDSLPFYSLVSKEIKSLRANSQYESILDKDFLISVISSYYPECFSLQEFCFTLTEKMGLKKTYYDPKEFQENIESIIENNIKNVERATSILKDQLTNKIKLFDDNLINKIANSFLKSCICISLTIFKRIQDAYKILNEKQIKDLKAKILTEIDLDIIRERKFNLVFHSLLNYYRANKIRPIDPTNESIFHDKVFAYLLDIYPHDIEDESDVAHGILDLLVHGIPVELKFENKEKDIEKIYYENKDQYYDYLYKKEKKIGFLYIYENTKKGPKYPKKDIDVFNEQGSYCIVMILRGNFPKSTDLKNN